jgi:hypothetical protein
MRIAAFPAKIARLGGCGWLQRGVCLALAEVLLDPRKERLAQLLQHPPAGVVYSEHEGGDGKAFRRAACRLGSYPPFAAIIIATV